MNNTTKTTDERCAELARDGMALAYRVATFKPNGWFNDPQRVRDCADRIIALREAEAQQARETAQADEWTISVCDETGFAEITDGNGNHVYSGPVDETRDVFERHQAQGGMS